MSSTIFNYFVVRQGVRQLGNISHEKLVLTQKGMSRSKWDLPGDFKGKISYHTEASFKKDYFQSASRGQEFVVDADDKIMGWVKDLFM